MAQLVQDNAFDQDFWCVTLRAGEIEAACYHGRERLWYAATSYESVPRGFTTPEGFASSEGPCLLPLEGTAGERISICGTSAEVALRAAALVGMVLTRQAECEAGRGRTRTVRLNDERLAGLLLDVYADQPVAVAEAIMALKRQGRSKHRWLTCVLWDRPELRALARMVNAELTGR